MKPLKMVLLTNGVALAVVIALTALKLRPREITAAELQANHDLLDLTDWQLRWRFGWEHTRKYLSLSGRTRIPDLTWKIENGGLLTVGLYADGQGCEDFFARIPQGGGKEDLIFKDSATLRYVRSHKTAR